MDFFFEKSDWKIKSSPSLPDFFGGLKDGFYKAEIVRKKDTRSVRQNALLHAWLTQLERESHVGYTAEEWKEVFRSMFLTTKKRNKLDRRKWVTCQLSTAELDTVEFNLILEKIRISALTTNVWPVRLLYPELSGWQVRDEVTFEQWLATFD